MIWGCGTDLTKSRVHYLGYSLNRPAKDGDEYADEGIYVFNVSNLYTGETTTKTIYVGTSPHMKALSLYNITVEELNERLKQRETIADDGRIVLPVRD